MTDENTGIAQCAPGLDHSENATRITLKSRSDNGVARVKTHLIEILRALSYSIKRTRH
jgi:hypothetical protein